MNQTTSHNASPGNVLDAIKNGRIKMRPKWHFALQTALGAMGGVMLLLTLLYLASLVIFMLHQTGVWFAPRFGFAGWYTFLVSFPWLLMLLAVVFIIILEILVRHYAFTYRYPLLYSALGIILLVVLGGIVVASTPLHGKLYAFAEKNQLPFAGPMYRGFGDQRFPDIHQGKIMDTATSSYILENRHGEILTIIVSPRTRLPVPGCSVGDTIFVFGNRTDHTVEARGIQKIGR